MHNNNTQQQRDEYSRADLARLLYFVLLLFGWAYWVLFLIVYAIVQAPTEKLAVMSVPYAITGMACLLVASDAFRSRHYWVSGFVYLCGLIMAGFLA